MTKSIHDMDEDELFEYWNAKYGGDYKDTDARDHAFVVFCESNNIDFSL